MFRGRDGFTLIEILAILAIIAILSTITINYQQRVSEKSQDFAIKAELVKIQTLAQMYFAQNGQTYGEEYLHNANDSTYPGGIPNVVTNFSMKPCPAEDDVGNSMFHSDGGSIAKQINTAMQTALGKSSVTIAGCAVTKSDNVSYAVAVMATQLQNATGR